MNALPLIILSVVSLFALVTGVWALVERARDRRESSLYIPTAAENLSSVTQSAALRRLAAENPAPDAIRARILLDALKTDLGCSVCRTRVTPRALQWAHLPGMPKYRTASGRTVHPADMTKAGRDGRTRYAWSTILGELSKCRVLCANCHTAETFSAR